MKAEKKRTRINKLAHRFREDRKEFSFGVAVARLVLDCPYFSWEFRRDYYEKKVYKYLEKKYLNTIRNTVASYNPATQNSACEKIWVMWWHGAEQMPPIVKACYNQLMSIKGSREVVLITQNNYREWVEIPSSLVKKMEAGKIVMANFSDVIRVALLKKWGGVWLDATIYAKILPEELFSFEFFSLRADGLFPNFISRGGWSPFLLAAKNTNTLFFECLYNLFIEYWENVNKSIDYLLVDYFILLIRNNVKECDELFKALPINESYYMLNNAINEKYDKAIFDDILNKSALQKLSYRKELYETLEGGALTNYGYLLRKHIKDVDVSDC